MPVIDLGSVVGPKGPQGDVGPAGGTGEQGSPGPNEVKDTTSCTLTGVLAGNGSKVIVQPMDSVPTAGSTKLVNSGNIRAALDLRADPGQLAYVEEGETSSRRHSVGEYFCRGGLLYRVTAVISNGEAFTTENCTQVSEGGFNHLKPLDISASITAFANRLTNVTVKAYYYPSNRKIELSAYGEAATTLTAAQNTLLAAASAYAPSGVTYVGSAMKQQSDIVAAWTNSTSINVQHGGLSQGDSVAISLIWYI